MIHTDDVKQIMIILLILYLISFTKKSLNMMNKLLYYCSLILFIIALSCATGQQDLQRGDYDGSIKKAIERLRSNPNNSKASSTLKQAYPLSLNYHQTKIQNLKASSKAFKWEEILASYVRLNAIHEDLQRCPACLQVVKNPQNFITEAEAARTEAAEERYQAGMAALNQQERVAAQQAFNHFKKAGQLKRNYKDVALKQEEALEQATLKVVVERVPDPYNQATVNSTYFNEKLVEYLQRNSSPNQFVRLYAAQEAVAANVKSPDHYVMMSFQNFAIGQPLIQERVENASKDSVVIGQVEVDGVKRDVYGTVTAKVTVYEKTLPVTGQLNMQIMDANNQSIFQQQYPSTYNWSNEWGNFNGDERALTTAQLRICNEKEEPLPPHDELFIEFSRPIFSDATSQLSNYYRNR